MSEDRTAYHAALDLEDSIVHAKGLAACVACLGTGPSMVPPHALSALGASLVEMLDCLEGDWKALLRQMGGKP